MSILFFLSGLAIRSFLNLCIVLLICFVIGRAIGGGLFLVRLKGRKGSIPFAPFLTIGLTTTVVYGEEIPRLYLGR